MNVNTNADARATPSAFVRVVQGRFTLAGAPHYPVGVNFWQAMNLGRDGPPGDRARLQRELDRLAALGINNIRIMAGTEGPAGAPYRVHPALQTAPGQYDEQVFAGLDDALAEAGQRGIKVVMVLTNFWEWSGGMAQYVTWDSGDPIPYPSERPWTEFTAHAARFYACARCDEWFRAHVATVLERTNTVTGIRYRDDPTIFAWELANEPRLYPERWIDDTAAFIRARDPNHMITTGSEGRVGGPFIATHDGPDIDYATAHLWPQNWGWYAPARPETLTSALAEARAYVLEHERLARETLRKPLVLEEFGLARDADHGVDPYDPRAPTTRRDRFYELVYQLVEDSARAGGSLQGDALWAWAGEARPGAGWVGDPPHERPGWYSVYDRDASTLERIRGHGARLQALTGAPENASNEPRRPPP